MLTISGVAGLRERSGQELGVSAWHTVTQAHIDAFAAATDDYERIHVDPERAARTPFGVTIAHGLYTLSLGPKFLYEIMAVEDVPLALNYGFDRVRFISPVPVGSRVRMTATLLGVEEAGNGIRARVEQRFEIEGHDKPACVAESIVLYFERDPVAA
ncbi:MAG TPA: MaoC family dehydratase [Baekduia sp.]|uniref:MaoC family dehydratase n=1 Tax=Baekduia sp. TaxID=2600305 RepID=UPI002D79506E|nr:MaoC family dehydratase [Baekduia sp.]HET6507929.1 MaoC family dehydratase [Baekduia sp.]